MKCLLHAINVSLLLRNPLELKEMSLASTCLYLLSFLSWTDSHNAIVYSNKHYFFLLLSLCHFQSIYLYIHNWLFGFSLRKTFPFSEQIKQESVSQSVGLVSVFSRFYLCSKANNQFLLRLL